MRVRPMYVLIAMCFTVNIARCNLRVYPQNAAVIAGQVMAMECRTQGGSVIREWTLLRAIREEYHKSQQGSRADTILSNWDSLTSHTAEFWVDVDHYGSGTLYSNSTTLEVAGLYGCAVESGHELTRWSAHLIVFESTLFCDTNLNASNGDSLIDGTRIWMRCTVKFRGYWPPSMEWRRHGEDNKNGQIVTADEVEESENFNITSAISIIFKSSINGSFFSCKIYFSAQKPRLHANASNTPDFSYVWKSPEITKTQANYPTSHHASLTTTPLETKHNSSTNIYLLSLTAVGILAIVLCFVTTILCIRMKKTSAAKLVKMPLDEVAGPHQRAVSSSESMYENIDDEAITTMQTGQDTHQLTVLLPDWPTSFTTESVSLCPDQQIQAIDKGYENARTRRGNQPVKDALPTLDAECQSTGEDYQSDLYSEIPRDNSRIEFVSYTRMVAQVKKPAPYESLQPFSASKPI